MRIWDSRLYRILHALVLVLILVRFFLFPPLVSCLDECRCSIPRNSFQSEHFSIFFFCLPVFRLFFFFLGP